MPGSPDVLIVGAGPAGVSAALWARSYHLLPALVESGAAPGGQLRHIHFHPLDLVGVDGGDGPDIAGVLARQLRGGRIEVRTGLEAVALEAGGEVNTPRVVTADGGTHDGAVVVVATGVRRRKLDVPGEAEFDGRGVSYSASRDRAMFANRRVVVVGGGDGAFENALLLSDVGCKVTLVMRGMPRARHDFLARVAEDGRIEVLAAAYVTAIRGDDWVKAVRIETEDRAFERPVDGVVIKIGVIPNTEWCAKALDLDPEGYVIVDAGLRTARTRVWAVGDVTRPTPPSLAVAAGHGAIAMAGILRLVRPE